MRGVYLLAAMMILTAGVPPREEAPRFRIGAIADVQYAAQPDAPPRLYHTAPTKLAAAVQDLNREKLDFVVHLGDFIDRDWASYDAMLPIARKLRHPWHFALGNHEFAIDDQYKPQVPAKLGMPARYYSFTRHGWLFLVTDGNDLSSYAWPAGTLEHQRSMNAYARHYAGKPLWNGGIGDAQLAWIDRELTRADRQGLNVMLLNHFPIYPENKHNLWNADAVRAVVERHRSAKLWLDGHNHQGNYGMHQGVHYVNLKAMLDTDETAYARLDFFVDRVELKGRGRQEDMVLALR